MTPVQEIIGTVAVIAFLSWPVVRMFIKGAKDD